MLLAGLLIQCQQALYHQAQESSPVVIKGPVKASPSMALASPTPGGLRPIEPLEARAARDPIASFEEALDQYDRSVRDYTCTFTKQELVGGQLTAEQVIKVMFREKPFSVRFEWIKNADKCDRVLYVKDRWIKDGQQMAVVEPGPLARLFVRYLMQPIHGELARKTSRRTIDQFGLRNSLTLALKYCKLAREMNVPFEFTYEGKGEVDHRETLVFKRRLPYTGEDGFWPDRVLVIHVDKELLFPTLCLCYADDDQQVLLGKYMTTDIRPNVNLPDSTFTKEGMGL